MRHCSSPRWPPCSIRLVSGPPSARRVGGERSIAHRRRRDGVGVSAPERAIAVDASELEYLAGIGLAVAPLLGYWPAVRLLLTAWVPGRRLTELLAERADTAIAVARAAGRWAARLHGSDMPTPRSCGPAKQRA